MRWLLSALVYVSLTFAASAQLGQNPRFSPVQTGGGGGCTQATTFLARTSGLSGTESSAYTALICGLVTDGTYSAFDVLYLFATNNTTSAVLNIISTSNTAAAVGAGSVAFTADRGIVFNSAGVALYSTIAPNGGTNCTQNSCAALVCVQTDTGPFQQEFGADNNTNSYFHLTPRGGGGTEYDINDSSFSGAANASSTGLWITTRTSSSAIALYHNATLQNSNAGATSAAPNAFPIYIGAVNSAGTAAGFSLDQIGGFGLSSGLSSGQVTSVNGRFHTFFTTLFGASPC